MTFGSPGLGTTPHLAGELFKRMAKIEMTHVPYRGDAPALKIANTKASGAEVVLHDRVKESREEIGMAIAKKTGATVVPPYDHPWILTGQGTAGRRCKLGPEHQVSDPVTVDIAAATGGRPEAVGRAEAGNDETVGAVGPHFLQRLVGFRLLRVIGYPDFHALLREFQCDAPANTARATGDQRSFPFQ